MKTEKTDNFILNRFTVGPLDVNCYCVTDSESKETCLIDPGAGPDLIKRFIAKNNLNLKIIINTHGHGDHIAANGYFNAPIYIHHLDKDALGDPEKNLSKYFIFPVSSPPASNFVDEGDKIEVGSLTFTVLHTPGHSPGSISLSLENVLFTGDALFKGSVGRTDLPGGDEGELFHSINSKLLAFPDDTIVYPGHGEDTTIGYEKKNNPYLMKRI